MSLRDYLLKQAKIAHKEYVGTGPDPEKQQELHDKIARGEIDIGPMPNHSQPMKDLRPTMSGEEAYQKMIAERNGNFKAEAEAEVGVEGHDLPDNRDPDMPELWKFDR